MKTKKVYFDSENNRLLLQGHKSYTHGYSKNQKELIETHYTTAELAELSDRATASVLRHLSLYKNFNGVEAIKVNHKFFWPIRDVDKMLIALKLRFK